MDDEQARLYRETQKEIDDENLWRKMQIDFQLEAFRFPDSKIYGIVNIIPELSRQFIRTLVLVVNKTNRIEFNPQYTHLSASGFNINKNNPSVYVEAIPYNTKWKEKKTSKICYFHFTGEVFVLSPMINFHWFNEKTYLVIQWYHIGDNIAQKYVLYLDGGEIQYIRQKSIAEVFDIRIEGFEAGKKHTFQLAARLNNGKETYRSDLMEFTVPDRQMPDAGNMEFITVSNDSIPPNLPAYMPMEDEKIQDDFNPNEDKVQKVDSPRSVPHVEPKNDRHRDPPPGSQPTKDPKPHSKIYTCCNNTPHRTFPGVNHYFKNTNQPPLSSPSEENTDDDDDDNDVIMPHN